MRRFATAVLLFCTGTAGPTNLHAQVIEFEPPSEIVVDTTRLIVTFVDTVDLDTARNIVLEAGGRVSGATFRDVTVWALFDAPPEPEPLLALRADPRAAGVIVYPPSAAPGKWVTLENGQRVMADFSSHALRVDLPPSTAEDKAAAVVHAYFPTLVVRVERYPNELTVDLPADGPDVASVIESSPLVQYVTYFSIPEPGVFE